jgi:hypothetical protein
MCPTFYTGTKWLKDRAVYRAEGFEKIRNEAYEYLSNTLNEKSHDWHDLYISARMDFCRATREVRKSYSCAAYS